jgi:hypothetical protein
VVTIDSYSWQSDGKPPLITPAFKVFTNVTTITDSQDFQSRDGGFEDNGGDVGC